MKYKICEYERGNGEKYYIISRKSAWWVLGWEYFYEDDWYRYFPAGSSPTKFNTFAEAYTMAEGLKQYDAEKETKRNWCKIV
jgi:hypothetical protein